MFAGCAYGAKSRHELGRDALYYVAKEAVVNSAQPRLEEIAEPFHNDRQELAALVHRKRAIQ
jgi:hypothetical protein